MVCGIRALPTVWAAVSWVVGRFYSVRVRIQVGRVA